MKEIRKGIFLDTVQCKVSKVEPDGAEITSDDGKAAVRIAFLAVIGFEVYRVRFCGINSPLTD